MNILLEKEEENHPNYIDDNKNLLFYSFYIFKGLGPIL